MRPKSLEPWLPADRIDQIVQIEPILVILALAAGSWAVYKLFLREAAAHRHRNLRKLFLNLAWHATLLTVFYGAYELVKTIGPDTLAMRRLGGYLGLFTLFAGATVFVKTFRILVFEYLFLGHMKAGVPLLLVNLTTLLLSITIGAWMVTQIFSIQVAPLLATSAVFSIVLGLALQDTLGNLFAGVALQFDKPYEIGDWVEVDSGGQKWVGQIHEISWRATVLTGLSDENITLPNRVMAQAQVSNFSVKSRPIIRTQTFRVPHGSDPETVRSALLRAAQAVPSIRRDPPPTVLLRDSTESWLLFRILYFIDDYGAQWSVGDRFLGAAIDELGRAGVQPAMDRLQITRSA